MSDRDTPDDESTEDLWDEIEEFAEADPDEAEEIAEGDPNEVEEFVEVEEVTDVDPADQPPAENGGSDRNGMAVDEELPNAEDAPDADEVFAEMDVSAVDGESLWDELSGAETEAGSFDGDGAATVDAGPGGSQTGGEPTEPSVGMGDDQSTGDSDGETEALIDKRAYCQQCPYFSAPPEIGCRHAGTEIVEVLTDGRFRVTNCPVVTETGPDRTILNDGS